MVPAQTDRKLTGALARHRRLLSHICWRAIPISVRGGVVPSGPDTRPLAVKFTQSTSRDSLVSERQRKELG